MYRSYSNLRRSFVFIYQMVGKSARHTPSRSWGKGNSASPKLNCDVNSSWSPLYLFLTYIEPLLFNKSVKFYVPWLLTCFSTRNDFTVVFLRVSADGVTVYWIFFVFREYCRGSRMVFNKGKCEIILYDKWLEDCCINVILLKESCSQCDRNMTVLRIGIFKWIRLYH